MKILLALLCPALLLLLAAARADSSEPVSLTLYIPVKNVKLERHRISSKLYGQLPTAPSTYASIIAEKALPLLFQKSRSSFPKGTKLTKFPKVENDVMQVSLSKAFLQRGFWNSRRRTWLAVYAIVNTAVAGYELPDNHLSVRLLIEGKPLRNLANIDMREPLRPRFDRLIKHKAS